MRKVFVTVVAIVALLVVAGSPLAAGEIGITVSPNVINISSSSTVVTLHTDIEYGFVVGETVVLTPEDGNPVVINSWKADLRGFFVAKFLSGEVKGVVEEGTTATLTLSGETVDGTFSGSDDVRIIDVKQKR